MSGGAYQYRHFQLEMLADDLETRNEKEIVALAFDVRHLAAARLRELAAICHDIEWVDSSDYGPEEWPTILKRLECFGKLI